MKPDVFDHLKGHYTYVADELRSTAKQARFLTNSTATGTEREEIYRVLLERFLPKMCDVFLGGYLFDLHGRQSAQMDVIITAGNAPRFRMPQGDRHIAPLEGSIGVVEIKSRLDRNTLRDALRKCGSIPPMPDSKGLVSPSLKIPDDKWKDIPYKVIFAYDGITPSVLCSHIVDYYNQNATIPRERRPNLIHVLGKYVIIRMTHGMKVINSDGQSNPHQPDLGQYDIFSRGPDVAAMAWVLNQLYEASFLSNHIFFKFDNWFNEMIDRMQRELP